MFQPSQYQKDIFNFVQHGSGNAVVTAVAGSGKCLGKNTPVLMYDGTIKSVQDIEVNDQVMGPDSQPRTVLDTTSGYGPLYEVSPIKGMPWVCNEHHVLTLAGTNRFKGQVKDIPLNEYLTETRPSPLGRIDRQWKLFHVGVDFPEQPVEVDPYLVGLWLGDGTTADVAFTNQDQSIIDYLVEVAPHYGAKAIIADREGHGKAKYIRLPMSVRGTPSILRKVLLGQCRNSDGVKYIPHAYLKNSRENRLKLLAGLIDTDGHFHMGYYEVTTKHAHLADQIAYLARSLDFASYVTMKPIFIDRTGETNTYYRVAICGHINEVPCRIPYKQAPKRNQIKNVQVTGFSVYPIGRGMYYGFMLDGDGRFLLGDFTVTHNSTVLKEVLGKLPVSASVLYVAFNSDAAKSLKAKLEAKQAEMLASGEAVPQWESSTIHSLGNRTLANNGLKCQIKNNKYSQMCRQFLQDPKNLDENLYDYNYVQHLGKLVDMVRLTLSGTDDASLRQVVRRFEIDLDVSDKDIWPVICKAVPAILEAGIKVARDAREIDFTDMIWLPNILKMSPKKYDFVLVDEAQDLSPAQRALVLSARHASGRFIAVGDVNQAIYGFAGASLESIQEIIDDTQAISLPLSICYRCPKSVVEFANTVRPGTEASPTASEGTLEFVGNDKVDELVQAGDLILCRFTAPLVSKCLELLREGKRANVRGKDLGTTFVSLIEKMQKHFKRISEIEFFMQLVDFAREYERQQISILSLNSEENEMQIASLQDKIDTLLALYEAYHSKQNGHSTLAGFFSYIKDFFAEDKDAQIILSTGHRAKGLEYNRVFILKQDELPCSRARTPEQMTQELNLMYVMYTRAKQALYCVVASLPNEEPVLESPVATALQALVDLPLVETVELSLLPETSLASSQSESGAKRGRPSKADEEKRHYLQISLSPEVLAALGKVTKNRSALIEQLLLQHPAIVAEMTGLVEVAN